jgi:hypothetical protein
MKNRTRPVRATGRRRDANNQCAHLNYTNRVANGLGLLTEAKIEEGARDRVPQ